MPIMMVMEWPGVTAQKYDEVRSTVNWEGDVPTGAKYHVASFPASGARITDVWDSAEDFQRFVDERLMPGVQKVGVEGEPTIEIFPTHAIFAPAYE
jgi:hypothetical protein